MTMGIKKSTDSARGSAERNEDHGKASDEGKCGRKKTRARNLALSKLLHPNAGEHGDVTGDKGKNARRKKRDKPGEKGSCESDFIVHSVAILKLALYKL